MMSHVKTIFFLILCVAVGIGIGKAYIWWREPAGGGLVHSEGPTPLTGLGDAPEHRGFAVKATDLGTIDALLKQAHGVFATTIGIEYDPSLTPETLASAVTAAHRQNMAIMLLPPPTLVAQNPYPRPLAEIAAAAEAAGVEYLCVSWLNTNPDPAYWRRQGLAVRAAYHGQIVLAAQPGVLAAIECWDAADMIGAIGPIPLARRLPNAPAEVTVHDMRVAWDCSLSWLESLARVNKKRLALLHMNVPAEISARLASPEGANVTPEKNPALQALVYEALLLETKGRVEITDVLLFNWGHAGDGGAPNNVPGLMVKVSDAWDPKKPRSVETAPAEPPAEGTEGAEGTESAESAEAPIGADGAAGN